MVRIKYNQICNLYEFIIIFLSGDMDLEKTTPDYYMEKYNKYIGVDVKTNSII